MNGDYSEPLLFARKLLHSIEQEGSLHRWPEMAAATEQAIDHLRDVQLYAEASGTGIGTTKPAERAVIRAAESLPDPMAPDHRAALYTAWALWLIGLGSGFLGLLVGLLCG